MRQNQEMKTMRLILLAIATTTAASAQNYAIHMSAPVPAGQRFSVSSIGSTLKRNSSGDRVLKEVDYQVQFQGRAAILDVDGKGRPVKIAFTVEKLTKTERGTTIDLLKPGSVVVADGSLEQPIYLKDGTMDESVREAFRLVYSTHKPDDVTDDEVFGTKQAKRIGDRWPIDLALASENLKDSGVVIPVEHLSGTVSLIAKNKIGVVDCLDLRGELRADEFTMKQLPPGVTADRAGMQAVFRGCFPVESSQLSHKEGFDMTMQIRLTSSEGVKIDVIVSETREAVWMGARD